MQYFNRQINVKLSIFGTLLFLTILSSTILSSSISSADTEKQSDATVTVGSACTMFRESTVPHVVSVGPSSYREDVGTTRLKTVCNDTNGYAIYAIGYSNDTDGDTNMYGEEHGLTIPTGTESGDVSNWSMKLSKDLNAYNPESLTIENGFGSYSPVPSTQTVVVSFEGATDTTNGSIVETTYAIRVASDQLADTYTGQVKYTMVHPSGSPSAMMDSIDTVTMNNCPTTPTEFYDPRDFEVYTVQRMADGNCWFLDNLRLDLVNTPLSVLKGNTNASDETLEYLKGVRTGTTSDQWATEGVSEWIEPGESISKPNSYSAPQIHSAKKDDSPQSGYQQGKIGIYYNYCAASAGSYCYGDGGSSYGESVGNATEDICPKGWRMPTGGSIGEFQGLYDAYNNDGTTFANTFHLPLAGYTSNGYVNYLNEYGMVWSSSRAGSNMYYLIAGRAYVDAQSTDYRTDGKSVRCIAREADDVEPVDFQSVTPTNCSAVPMMVRDTRDGEVYTVQKLADGNCWLLDNLRLDLTDSTVQSNLSSSNTNASDTTLNYLKHGGGTSANNYAMESVEEWAQDNSYTKPMIYTADKEKTGYYGYYHGKYGVYYNYCAATAGSYCRSGLDDEVTEDICPKGWRMPTGGPLGEYQKLQDLYYSRGVIQRLRTPLSGYVYSGTAGYQNTNGWFWSSSISSPGNMYRLSVSTSNGSSYDANAQSAETLTYGVAVRCVAIDTEFHGTYIQDVTSDTCTADEMTVYDKRDLEKYTIRKLADGKCWLMENLRLDPETLTTELNSGNTNISASTSFTLPRSISTGFGSRTAPQINTDSKNAAASAGYVNVKTGVYYNYCAASAGTICANSNAQDATEDICPKGWRMVTQNELENIYGYYRDYTGRNILAPLVGRYYGNGVVDNLSGFLWSSTNASDADMYDLLMNVPEEEESHPDSSMDRGYGATVRCVAKDAAPVYSMQDMSIYDCPTTPIRVYDERDNESYLVQKLADGNCWMLENLRLDPETLNVELTTENTNMSPNVTFTLPPSRADAGGNETAYTEPQINTEYKNELGYFDNSSNKNKIGVFYNFCATSAGTVCAESGENEFDASYDICPKGWRLPTGGEGGEYQALYNAYGGNANNLQTAVRATRSGFFTGSLVSSGSYTMWASSVHSNGSDMYGLGFASGYISASVNAYRNAGFAVRCIAGENKKIYLQNITVNNCPTEPTLAYDSRDNETYYVGKLADGNCWLLDNLRLDPTTLINPLTPENTNMSPDVQFSLPEKTDSIFEYNDSNYKIPLINTVYKNNDYDNNGRKGGVQYDFCAVSAGTYCHESYVEGSSNAYYDICPKGWRLPTGGNNGEMKVLSDAYNNDPSLFTEAFRSRYSGFFSYGAYASEGEHIWTSSIQSPGSMFAVRVYKNSLSPDVSFKRNISGAVRCVAKNGNDPAHIDRTGAPHDIQDITLSNCPTNPTKVYDTRDDSAYYVQKLPDGNCWMLDNLNLGRRTLKVLTPDDTNITSEFILPGSISVGFNDYTTPQINIDSRNDSTSYGDGENKIGVYYNYCAATAGTYCQPQGTSSGSPVEDICPRGWRMPTGGDGGEYQNLYEEYDTYTDFKNALHASLSGYFKYSGNNHQGSYGSFWSTTPVGDDRMYSLDVRLSKVPNDFTSYRTAGLSIRCIAKEVIVPHYIQDVTASTCPSVPTTVYDSRDGESYLIQKMNDGRCWMLENLRLGSDSQTYQLTSQDTNISPLMSFTLPVSGTGVVYDIPVINTDNKNLITNYENINNKYGNTYNYCAATAGTICGEGQNMPDPIYDICPKGWRLPTGSYEGEFKALYESYDNDIDSFISVFKIASRYSTFMNTVMWASTNSRVKSSSHDPVDALEMIPTNTVDKVIDTITGINGRDLQSSIRCILK